MYESHHLNQQNLCSWSPCLDWKTSFLFAMLSKSSIDSQSCSQFVTVTDAGQGEASDKQQKAFFFNIFWKVNLHWHNLVMVVCATIFTFTSSNQWTSSLFIMAVCFKRKIGLCKNSWCQYLLCFFVGSTLKMCTWEDFFFDGFCIETFGMFEILTTACMWQPPSVPFLFCISQPNRIG